MGRVFVVALACLSFSCTTRKTTETEEVVRQYIRLSVALGDHDPNSLDYYYGPSEWVADVRAHPPKLAEIKQACLDLITRLHSPSPGPLHKAFLVGQLRALVPRADLLRGIRPSFDQEAGALFALGVVPAANHAAMES